jgi:hypothetical protein
MRQYVNKFMELFQSVQIFYHSMKRVSSLLQAKNRGEINHF